MFRAWWVVLALAPAVAFAGLLDEEGADGAKSFQDLDKIWKVNAMPVTSKLLPKSEVITKAEAALTEATVKKAEAEIKEGEATEAEGEHDKNNAEVQTGEGEVKKGLEEVKTLMKEEENTGGLVVKAGEEEAVKGLNEVEAGEVKEVEGEKQKNFQEEIQAKKEVEAGYEEVRKGEEEVEKDKAAEVQSSRVLGSNSGADPTKANQPPAAWQPLETVTSWNYQDQAVWGDQCGVSAEQSPIVIDKRNVQLIPEAAHLKLEWPEMRWQTFFNDGRTVKVQGNLSGCVTTYKDEQYVLDHFSFTKESEHVLLGYKKGNIRRQRFPLEVEFVHSAVDPKNQPLIISVMFKYGLANSYLDRNLLWMRLNELTEGAHRLLVSIGRPSDLILNEFALYEYQGSMSTPPCTPATRLVMRTQPQLSYSQVVMYPHPGAYREDQPLNGRVVKYFCGGDC